jgi:hypothetical protein
VEEEQEEEEKEVEEQGEGIQHSRFKAETGVASDRRPSLEPNQL